MIPILVKSDDVRSGRKAKIRHRRLRPAQESMGKMLSKIDGNLALSLACRVATVTEQRLDTLCSKI